MAEILQARVEQKVDTEANWLANPLILLDGECAFVLGTDGLTPINFKIGDGTKAFAALPYWINYAANVVVATVAPGSTLPNAGSAGKIIFLNAGNYTNIGGGTSPIVAAANSFNMGFWDGTTWSLILSIPISADLSAYQLIANALKTDTNGYLYGAIIPDVQYKHVRGDTEIAGNATYVVTSTQDGIGMYEQMTQNIVVNQLTIPIWGALDSAVTVRLYKGTTTTFNPNLQTLLEQVIIPAGSFNSTALTNAVISLTGSYKLATNDYVFIYLNVTAGTKLSYRYWNVLFGSAPERHIFAFHTTASGSIWTAAWSGSSAGFYQSSFILSQKSASQIALENSIKTLQATAVVADSNADIKGVKIPLVQWQHVRGDAEEAGNTVYPPVSTNYGICYYDQVTNNVVFNSVSAPIWATANTAITVRWYKSSGFTNVIANQTLLSEQLFAAGTWNSTTGAIFEFKSATIMHANANEYVYMYVYWTAGSAAKLAAEYWNVLYGSAPERHTFLTLGAATGWASNWTIGGAGFYQPSLKFRYRSDVETDLINRVTVLELNKPFNPNFAIPAKVNVAIGREFNIWNDALVKDWDNEKDVSYASSVTNDPNIKPKQRCFRYTGAVVENKTITVTVRNSNTSTLGTQAFLLNIVPKNNGSGNLNIVTIGDSTIAGVGSTISAPIATEIRNLFIADGGASPYLLGVNGTAPNRHEGRGGWGWANYLTAGAIANGPNAFWDATNSRNDFQKWMTTNSNFASSSGTVDIAIIQLGINDVNAAVLAANVSLIDTAIANAKTFINTLLNATTGFPSCKVILSMTPTSSITRDGYAASFPYYDKEIYDQYMRLYHIKLIQNFDAGIFNANVSVCASYLNLDRVNGYDKAATPISARFTTTELQYTSTASVHPNDSGYYQAADMLYSHIRSLL